MAELMTLEEVAEYLRVTKKTVYRLLEKRGIPSIRVGHQWRFDKSVIGNWLRSNSSDVAVKLLVIDDDEAICGVFRDTLEADGHQVKTCSDSEDGLHLAQEESFDIVFLDLMMPKMDGAAVFREIHAARPDTPVTIITAFPESELMMKAMDYGPFSVMKKPFAGSDILNVVKSYLQFGKSTR